MSEPRDWDLRADELSADAIRRGEPTAWFDDLYAAGSAGEVSMPWDRTGPQVDLQTWAEREQVDGSGRRAVVVGCGLGADAEYLATLGFTTTAFDIAPTAVEVARGRNPGSAVDYRVADLLALPAEWERSFDLVVEIFTLQALPDPPREQAADAVTGLVADGGTLLDRRVPVRRLRRRRGRPAVPSRPALHGLARPRRAARRTPGRGRRPALAGDVPPLTARTRISARKN